MLTYFPTPYSGEWWYSVLCRYHIRSGNTKQQTTIRELFSGNTSAAIGAVYPNNTICRVAKRFPPGSSLDVKAIILHHTLFPFFTRFCTLEQKQEKLERLTLGETAVITSIRRGQKWAPRCCPQCVAEDRLAYGEAYWHIDHQIPLLTLCPVHGCQLYPIPSVDTSRLNDTFYPLDGFVVPQDDILGSDHPWQAPLSSLLAEYQSLPLEYAATVGHSNLGITLSNMGYGVIQKHSSHTILDGKKLYRDLTDHYGKPLVEQVFGGEALICNINRVCKWEMVTPERYALLQCFAGLSSEVLFSQETVPDRYQQELTALANSEVRYTKKQAAELLGVTQAQLDILLKRFNIPPFWPFSDNTKGTRKVSFLLNEEELSEFKAALQASGSRYDSHFAKHCILSYIRDHKKE